MTDAINSNNRLNPSSQAVQSRSKPSSETGSKGGAAKAPASTVVELSSEQVMQEIQQLPEIDSNRIESIKKAIANGEYQPNAETIAQKFAEIEKLLP